MTESTELFTFFVLVAVAISSIISGFHHDRNLVFLKPRDVEHPCESFEGFKGRECKPFCKDTSISTCSSLCVCGDGKWTCNLHLRTCSCRKPGWKGDNCTEPCDLNHYGVNCSYKCHCKHDATCDQVDGTCICAAGYQGSLCSERCSNGTHGWLCSNKCKCQNDANCHHVDGSCDCKPGWMGAVCAEPCVEGTYGINCSETCDCFKDAPCNATTGECIYTKDMFECNLDVNPTPHLDVNPTPQAKKLNDSQECPTISNKNNIICFPGFSGENCEKRACPANKWGHTCSNECKCRNGSNCHPQTGVCWCELGWAGEDCSVPLNGAQLEGQNPLDPQQIYSSSKSSFLVPAICVPMVAILLIIVASFVYYRKRSFRNSTDEDNASVPLYTYIDRENL